MVCSAIERLDCFELFVDPLGRVTNMPWPGKTLRLPKSLFRVLSDEVEACGLQLLVPLDVDKIHLPKSSLTPAIIETSCVAAEDPPPDLNRGQAAYAVKCFA